MKTSLGFVLAAALALGATAVAAQLPPDLCHQPTVVFQCPLKYGLCNRCMLFNGEVVALTRQLCPNIDKKYEHCVAQIFNGTEGTCGDGCNQCKCTADGIVQETYYPCIPYNQQVCEDTHNGQYSYPCGNSTCHCTPCGVGFSF
ncbi:hypothetical protein GQ42DRAFT_154776 [Ramicandelaber brevisporus]|nr:hypothetical protein GQ42DRAFT_154776 [Ramicandelaber brevisporus]